MFQMETLVIVSQHRNQYCSRSKPHGHTAFGSSSSSYSSPSRDFIGINCRTFQTGCGILPTPLKSRTSPSTKCLSSPSSSSKTNTPFTPSNSNKTRCKTTPISNPVPINRRASENVQGFNEHVPGGGILLSELWAGPTYSNSPPPSSLPVPKFCARPERSVSFDLPRPCPEVEIQLRANSAPSSPCGGRSRCAGDLFDSATKNLCRILNLNLDDE